MRLSVNKNTSENKTRVSNYGIYPGNSRMPPPFSRDPRVGHSVYSAQNNQHSSIINDKPPGCSSAGNYADVPSNSTKKSIVINNSSLSSASPTQSLCRVEFQNEKISLALPPGITWEEINAEPLNHQQIDNLLHFTYQLNSQLKRKKKRMRNFRNDSMSMDQRNQQYPYTRSCAAVPRNQSAKIFNHCESKPGPALLNKNKICTKAIVTGTNLRKNPFKDRKEADVQGSKVEPSVPKVEQSSSQAINAEPDVKSESSVKLVDVNKLRTYSKEELYGYSKRKFTDLKIIDALRRNMILSFYSPFTKYSCRRKSDRPPIFFSSPPNNPSTSKNANYDSKPSDLKALLQLSWAGSDDGGEAETSKQIYDNLSHQVESFGPITPNVIKTPQKKKKKKPEKKINQPEQIKATEDTVEIFDDYYDDMTIQEGLKNGTMFQDILRINGKNWREAFVSCCADNKDIFIDGIKNRNRALEGDEVVVELLPEKQANVELPEKPANVELPEEPANVELPEKPTNVPEDGAQKTTRKCGKVVRIVKENHPRTAVGSLKPVYNKKKMSIFHSPLDPRLPRIKITLSQCVPFIKLRTLKESVVFLAKITKWECVKNAEGILVKEIGDTEDPKVESQCILFENNLDVTPFKSSEIPRLPFEIPADEISRRIDIRSSCVFTIDPPGAQDLDDALSCRILPYDHIEVGIHIADVTHFLKSDTPLDLNARDKATSVYLTETVYHMLPFELCKLCSLTPGADKLAFSAFVEFDAEANVISHRFAKTAIRSCVQLTYAHAQEVIENDSESYEPTSFPPVSNGYSANDCVLSIRMLQKLASMMRKRRFAEGALKIDKPKIIFDLDNNRLPFSFSLYIGQECNWLIEEFMLLANSLVAEKILESFPETALLRSHNSPKEKSLSSAVESLEKVGIIIDTADAGSIYQSMMQYEGLDEIGMARMAVITNFLIKPMVKAQYVCSSESADQSTDFWHYALNTAYYTHFTSPIRRYADIVVHRLLAASIGESEAPAWSSEDIQDIAENCNNKKNSSKKASETSAELYLKIYLEKSGPIRARAVVIDVKERHFELIDLTTRTAGRIQINKIRGSDKVEFVNETMPSINVTWKNGPEPLEQIIQIFTVVDVEISFKKNSGPRLQNRIQVELLKPVL